MRNITIKNTIIVPPDTTMRQALAYAKQVEAQTVAVALREVERRDREEN